jgi:hypothetical protein
MFPYDGLAMSSILGTSLDAVCTINHKGIIADVNQAAMRMFGWRSVRARDQASRSCAKEAIALPPLVSGMMLNSSTVTAGRST